MSGMHSARQGSVLETTCSKYFQEFSLPPTSYLSSTICEVFEKFVLPSYSSASLLMMVSVYIIAAHAE